MNKKKGFTLIELLAVIVLLAILVIIAVPNVIKMLNNTNQKTFMVEAENVIKGAKNAYATNTLNGIDKTCYSLSELSDYIDKDFTGYSGSVQIDASHNTSRVWLANDKYIVAGSYSGNIEVVPLTSPITATDECEEMYVVANGEGEQVTTTMSALIDSIDDLEANAFLASHPIGSIYVTVSSNETTIEQMHTLYGGTWAVYGEGKVLVGLDINDTDFDSTTDTGGEKNHTLITEEIPSHNHSLPQIKMAAILEQVWEGLQQRLQMHLRLLEHNKFLLLEEIKLTIISNLTLSFTCIKEQHKKIILFG